MLSVIFAAAICGPPAQDAFPTGRFGAFVRQIGELRGPVDVIAAPDGGMIVVERDRDRLARIAPNGERSDFGPEDLNAPEDLCTLPGGDIAIADTGNARVVIVSPAGSEVVTLTGDGSLITPTSVSADADHLYVADPRRGAIHAFALSDWSQRPSIVGLVRPIAVEPGPDGEVFLLDAGTHRVEVYSLTEDAWSHRRGWGDFGPHAAFLGHPRDLALHDGRVLVADADNHRIQAFDLDGDYVYEWGKHALQPRDGEGSLHYPSGITILGEGDDALALVCEAFGDRIQVFERTDDDPARFMTDPGIMPWNAAPHFGRKVATAGDLLAIFEPETQTVLVHDLELEEPVEVTRLGGYGAMPGQHMEIVDIHLDADPWTVRVSDALTGRVSTWALDHDPDAPLRQNPRMASFAQAEPGWSATGEARPDIGAIARAWDGQLVVVDLRDGAVRLQGSGKVLISDLADPADLAFDGSLLWIVEPRSARVRAFDRAGRPVHSIEGIRGGGIVAGPDAEIFLTDSREHRVVVYGPDDAGRYVERRRFGSEGLGAGQLYRPAGIAIDARGRVIVLDHGNHRGMIFRRDGEFLIAFGPRAYVKHTRR